MAEWMQIAEGGDAPPGTLVNKASVGSTGEAETAASDTWLASSQSTGDGLSFTYVSRFAYNHLTSGDQTLYAYYRTNQYDNIGNLVAVSAETRVTIDVPDTCV